MNNEDLLRAAGVMPKVQDPVAEPEGNLTEWQAAAARAAGLPEGLSSRLTGSTEAEVFADASKLARQLGSPASPRAEAAALARNAIQHGERVRSLLPQSKVITPANETTERTFPEPLVRDDGED